MSDFNAGLEAAAKAIAKRRDAYVAEHGSYDPSTGTTEFPGNGDEYVGELDEIEELILALRRPDAPDAVREALRSLHTWVSVVAEKFDLDEDITCVRVSAVGPDGKRELASLSLRAVMDRASQALGGER